MLPYNGRLKGRSRVLRREMMDAERRLWSRLRGKQVNGCPFYRQKIIGRYIVDFYCARANLVVEVDGGHHFWGEQAKRDLVRDEFLSAHGLRVLRFSDREVLTNLRGVMERIYECAL